MKKILAILLTVCMVVCMIPGAAFADTGSTPIDLSNAVIKIKYSEEQTSRDYFTSDEVKADKFFTDDSKVEIKVGDADVDKSKCNIVIQKLGEDKIQITVEGNGTDTTGKKIETFKIISEVFNSTVYFLSTKPDRTVAIPGGTFTGSAIVPAAKVYLYKEVKDTTNSTSKIVEVNSSLYKLTYSNNTDAGVATVTAEGQGTATGTVTADYLIEKADFSKVSITAENTTVKDSTKYDVKAMLGSYQLKKATDYNLSFSPEVTNNTFADGTEYTVTVTPTEKNFIGTAKTAKFKVYNGFTGTVTGLDSNTHYTYDGTVKTPKLVVKKGENQVTNGYSVTYYNSAGVKVANPIDAGTYKVVVEGTETTGNNPLTGVWEGSFTIDPVKVQTISNLAANYVYMDNIAEQKYTGAELKPVVTVYYQADSKTAKKILVKDKDYTVDYTKNIAVGTGKATVKFKGNYKNLGTDLTKTFIISKGTLLTAANTTISGVNDTYDYTGYAIKPTVYVTYRSGYTSKALTQSTTTRTYDYKVDYSSNIAAGTATITVTGQGEYTGTVTKTFKIKYNLSNATVTATPSTYLYDGKEKKPLVSVKVGYMIVPASNYNVVYSNNTNTGTAAVTVTANKYGNAIGSNSTYFTIKGKDGVITPEYAEYSKKTTKSKPFAIKIVSNTTDGTGYSYVSSDTSVATVSANGTVTPVGCGRTVITITTTGNKAYNPATATVTVTVKPTKGIISSLKSTAKGKLTVRYKKQSPNADYYQIRYGRAGDYTTKTIKNTSARTGKSTIKGLQSGKKYFIKVRGVKVLEDGTRLYGTWSVTKNAVTK